MLLKKLLLYISAIISSILVTCDITTDILYWINQDFYNSHLKNASLAFILLYPIVGSCISMIYTFSPSIGNNPWEICNACLGCLVVSPIITALSPIILAVIKLVRPDSVHVKIFEKITKLEALFESLPQIIIQATNSTLMNNWSNIAIASISVSSVSLLYNFYSLTNLLSPSKEKRDLQFDFKFPIYIFIALFNLANYSFCITYMIVAPFKNVELRFVIMLFFGLTILISFLETYMYGEDVYSYRGFKPLTTFAFGLLIGKKLDFCIATYNFCSLFCGLIPILIIQCINNEATQSWGGLNLVAVILNCLAIFSQCCFHPCECFYKK
ncbi:hypothetical protein SteCoe_38060 [Stentor coeruleus]|uniref:Uncharacterized protein n=1 Tax=Stentor coeruleus TaxID=5963 RepID=A0A1R2AM78_9CILI|nr:hypothetical protein SteCoe_38060 [Stentor coeruleus]